MSQKFWGTRAYRQCSIQNTIYLLSIAILFLSRAQWVENELKMAFIFHIAKKCPHLQKPKCICNEFDIWIVFFRFINFFQDINILFISHITGLPGIRCSVFTASPDVSDFFLPKIGQKCQIGDFWGYSGPNLATL